MIDLRRALRNFDDVAPDDVVFDRARRGPSRPLPSSGGRRGERIVAAVTAFAVFALAGTFAWRALRETGKVEMPPDPRVEVVPFGADGSTLWPQRTHAELVSAQSRTDAGKGGFRWQLDREEVVNRFAESVLGWPLDSFQVTFETRARPMGDYAVAHLVRTAETCPERSADDRARGVPPCFPGAEDVTVVQPATIGANGIWAVSAVTAPTASLGVIPGQVVENGASVPAHLEVPKGSFGGWGTIVGGVDEETRCFTRSGGAAEQTDFDIGILVEPDATAGTECASRESGYLVLATATFDLACCGYAADPLVGDWSPYLAVTAVPIVVTIPENEPPPGTSVYEDPMGWKVNHPSGWWVRPFSAAPSDGLAPAVWISNMEVVVDAAPPEAVILRISPADPTTVRDDSVFPLSIEDFRIPPGVGNALSLDFRGNGVPYFAQLVVGKAVSDTDLATMGDVIASIRFPSLREGGLQNGWFSLGAGDHPRGQGSPANAGEPFEVVYLMRGTRGDYVLDLEPDDCGEGESETWDAERLEVWIHCPDGHDVRYERDGTPVPGNPPGFTEPLLAYPVITAWDGSLLVSLEEIPVVDIHERYWP